MPNQYNVAIVGAGISGLTAAYRLQQAGVNVHVFEAEEWLGGRVSSLQIDDFLINRGADIIPSGYAATIGLYQDLGLLTQEPEIIESVIGFCREGTVHRFRSNHIILDGIKTKLLSWRSKVKLLRLAVDAIKARRILQNGDFSHAVSLDTEPAVEYAARKLNNEIRRYLIQPIVHGISKNASILDFFFSATMTMGSGFVQYPGGIGLLTQTLAKQVPVSTNCRVTCVAPEKQGVTIKWLENGAELNAFFDAAVVAVPGEHAAQIIPSLSTRAAKLLTEDLLYSPLYLANFGLNTVPDETSGIIFMDADAGDGLVSISVEHNLRKSAAPTGKGLLTVLFTPAWAEMHKDKTDETLLDMMQEQIEKIMPSVVGAVTMRRLDRWQYGAQRAWPGYCAQIGALRHELASASPIQLAGDYFGSSSTNACVLEAERAANAILERLQNRSNALNLS